MTNYLKTLILIATTCFLSSSCSGSDNNGDSPMPDTPKLISSIPANDAKNILPGDLNIELTFDKNVTSPSAGHSKITIPNATVASVSANLTKVAIKLTGLLKATHYTLTIPKGVILGPAKVEADEIVINFSTTEQQTISKTLCTPTPSAEAQKLFDFMVDNYGQKIISGTMASVNWNTNEAEWVKKHTGKYPALNCFDYVHLYASPANWINYSNIEPVKNWWDNNGIVAAMWHWNVPKTTGSTEYGFYSPGANKGNGETSFNVELAVIDGTAENKIVKDDLERIADHLLLLKNENIPVIWRPLHEAAGKWFWWGAKGAEPFKKLWKMMFDTFQAKGLNNLIWVWTTETNDNSWYPGDQYVDIVGRDLYKKTTAEASGEFIRIKDIYTNKMITLSECGNVGNISQQLGQSATWSWFMPWYDPERTNNTSSPEFDKTTHYHADITWWNDAFTSSQVITRDQVPELKHKKN